MTDKTASLKKILDIIESFEYVIAVPDVLRIQIFAQDILLIIEIDEIHLNLQSVLIVFYLVV
jgi:hypothetical protein